LLNSNDLTGSITALHSVLKNADKLVNNINGQVDPLTTASLDTIKDLRLLVKNTDKRTEPAINSIRKTAEEARRSLRQASQILKTADNVIAERSPLRLELSDTLNEIADAARAVRILAEYIEQNPDALLRGK
jgi:paraquat-inducible protein B